MAKQTFTTGQVLTAAQMTSLQQTAMGGGSTTAKTTSYVLTAADAGTVVAMNAAGATTITVNTGLFSAGDTVFIQNWGAGTCTVTAGTATVTTHGSLALGQWEGGTLYFTSASAAIFFDISQTSGMTNPMTTTGDTIYSSSGSTPARLGIGSTGQVLTVAGGVPSWATPASGGGMTLLETLTLSGASVTSSTIAGTYKKLALVVRSYKPANNGEELQMRINGDSTANRYHYSTNTSTINTAFAQSSWRMSVSGNSTATATGLVYAEIYDYANTSTWKTCMSIGLCNGANDGTQINYQVYWNAYNQTGAITSLTFFPQNGNFTSGTVLIYGVS